MKIRAIEMNSHRAVDIKDRLEAELKKKNLLGLTQNQLNEISFTLVGVLSDVAKEEGFEYETEPGRVY